MRDFSLIETMLFDADAGFPRWRLHLARLERSAARLGFILPDAIGDRLSSTVAGTPQGRYLRVRLELFRDGRMEIAAAPFTPLDPSTAWTVRIASTRLSSTDPLLRYKTSRRSVYEDARAEWPASETDEVLLLNEHGDPCEGTITSLFLDDGSGLLKTPPISRGLLAGVLRTELICARKARVQPVSLDQLRQGRLYVGNALRGLIPARLVDPGQTYRPLL